MLATPSKYRSPWIQLLVYVLFSLGFFMTVGAFGTTIVARMNHISMDDLGKILDGTLKSPNAKSIIAGMQVLQFLCLFIIPALLFGLWADPKAPLSFVGFKKPGSNHFLWIAAVLVFAGLLSGGLLGYLNKQIPLPKALVDLEEKQNATIQALASADDISGQLASIFFVGVLAGVGEELAFRGCLQRIIIQICKSPWAGILITAALFSAFHMQFSGFLPRMFLGVALGALYWYSGSLWPGIIFHVVYNSVIVLAVNAARGDVNESEITNNNAAAIALGGAAVFTVIYLIIKMKRISKTEYAEVYPPKPESPFGG